MSKKADSLWKFTRHRAPIAFKTVGACCLRLALVLSLFMGVALVGTRLLPILGMFGPCAWAVHGFPCPGCHGTRSLVALSHGQIAEAFRQHIWPPLLLFVGGGCVLLPRRWRHHVWTFADRHWVALVVIGLLLWIFQWVRNLLRGA